MLTWQAADGHGFEGTRVIFGAACALRALGRIVRARPEGDYTASYRLLVREDGTLERVSITSATAGRERHLTMNRTEDGFWLLDSGSGATRTAFDGAVDVELDGSAVFTALPVRRLNLHREPGEHAVHVVRASLPELEPSLIEQRFRAAGPGLVAFSTGTGEVELTLDDDGMVLAHPGLARRYSAGVSAG